MSALYPIVAFTFAGALAGYTVSVDSEHMAKGAAIGAVVGLLVVVFA